VDEGVVAGWWVSENNVCVWRQQLSSVPLCLSASLPLASSSYSTIQLYSLSRPASLDSAALDPVESTPGSLTHSLTQITQLTPTAQPLFTLLTSSSTVSLLLQPLPGRKPANKSTSSIKSAR
jgi:hypothetical protein